MQMTTKVIGAKPKPQSIAVKDMPPYIIYCEEEDPLELWIRGDCGWVCLRGADDNNGCQRGLIVISSHEMQTNMYRDKKVILFSGAMSLSNKD